MSWTHADEVNVGDYVERMGLRLLVLGRIGEDPEPDWIRHIENLKAENARLREELEERRKWGESWCDSCALYYTSIDGCPECRLGSEGARLRTLLHNFLKGVTGREEPGYVGFIVPEEFVNMARKEIGLE